jgi:hypothetical protein
MGREDERDRFASHPRPANPEARKPAGAFTHYIIPGAAYAKAYAKLKVRGLQLYWQSAPAGQQAKAKKASKTKFTCPECAQNAWGKPDTLLICGACYEDGEGDICLMPAEATDEEVDAG